MFPPGDDAIVVLMAFVYMVRCSDGTLYVGHTNRIVSRERTHNEGRGARYTAERRPVKLVYYEQLDSTEEAIARERQLKRWSAKKKAALIAGDHSTLKMLSKRRRF